MSSGTSACRVCSGSSGALPVRSAEQRDFFGRQWRRARHPELAAAFAFARAQRHEQTAVIARAAVGPCLEEELEHGHAHGEWNGYEYEDEDEEEAQDQDEE